MLVLSPSSPQAVAHEGSPVNMTLPSPGKTVGEYAEYATLLLSDPALIALAGNEFHYRLQNRLIEKHKAAMEAHHAPENRFYLSSAALDFLKIDFRGSYNRHQVAMFYKEMFGNGRALMALLLPDLKFALGFLCFLCSQSLEKNLDISDALFLFQLGFDGQSGKFAGSTPGGNYTLDVIGV